MGVPPSIPWTPFPPPPKKSPLWEKTKLTIRKILLGHFGYTNFLVPPPQGIVSSNTSLAMPLENEWHLGTASECMSLCDCRRMYFRSWCV